MLYSANILILCGTAREWRTLVRRRNSRTVRCVLEMRPIAIRPPTITRAITITRTIRRGVIEIISRAKRRKSTRKHESQPQQQIARYVGAGVDGAITREQGTDVSYVPQDGESKGDVLPR